VGFAPDEPLLASASYHGVRLWNIRDPAAPALLGAPLTGYVLKVTAVAFAPDGDILASASEDATVRLWNIRDPAAPQQLGPPLTGSVNAVAFASNGNILATAGASDDTVLLWDTSDPAAPQRLGSPLRGHTGGVNSVAFTSDGDNLATAGDDGAVILWDLSGLQGLRAHAMERACAITGGGLSQAEWDRYVPGLEYVDVCAT